MTERLGVTSIPGATMRAFNLEGDRLGSVSVECNGQLQMVSADYHVAAMPVEVMQQLLTPELSRAAPSLARLGELRTEWMNGIQFYLGTDQPLADGHTIYLDSNWALTSISQRQFWRGYDLSTYGDGRVGGHPLGRHLELVGAGQLQRQGGDERRVAPGDQGGSLGAVESSAQRGRRCAARRRQFGGLVPRSGYPASQSRDRHQRRAAAHQSRRFGSPRGRKHLPKFNLFLAADYVRTYTDLATMEGANEAARRATNAILAVSGVEAAPCELWEFDIPLAMRNAQLLDHVRFRMGLPNLLLALG